MSALDLHLTLIPQQDNQYQLSLSFKNELAPARAPAAVASRPVTVDWTQARQLAADPRAMGLWLGALLFDDGPARQLLNEALAQAAALAVGLRCRLELPAALQALPWETMALPELGPLAASERILLSRFLATDVYRPAVRLRRDALTVALAVAAPAGLARYGLETPDGAALSDGLRAAVGEEQLLPVPATRRGLLKALRDDAGILCLAAHGTVARKSDAGHLFLATPQGEVANLAASDLAADLTSPARLPRLIVLISCHSAGSGDSLGTSDQALLSLGAQLVARGVPAVIAIRGTISFITAAAFLSSFFTELRRDWVVDRALGAARRDILARHDAWAPVLFMRLADGWLARPTALATAFAPPPLPADYVPRPAAHEAVIGLLLPTATAEPQAAVGITAAALAGAGGFGKTTLAQAISHDPRLVDAYPDGVLWLTLGEKPGDLRPLLNRLTTYLSGNLARANNLAEARQALAGAVRGQRLLLIVDDVWQAEHARPFLLEAPGCVVLLTTRNSQTLPVSAARVNVEAMAQAEAVSLLQAGLPAADTIAWADVAQRLGHWPLLLKLANGALHDRQRQGMGLAAAFADLIQTYDSLGITGFDAHDSKERQTAVRRTLALSLKRLQPAAAYGRYTVDEAARFRDLVVFPEDIDIPIETLAVYWRAAGFDEPLVRQLCARLYDLSLLLNFDRQNDTIRLHDVIRQYLGQTAPIAGLQRRLVAAYRELSAPAWQAFPYHAYMAEYAPQHMRAAALEEDLGQLLFSLAWIRTVFAATDMVQLVTEYERYQGRNRTAAQRVAAALRVMAGIVIHESELPGQLYGRLIGHKAAPVRKLVRQIEACADGPWLRPRLPVRGKLGGARQRIIGQFFINREPILAVDEAGTLLAAGSGRRLSVWDLHTGRLVHQWSDAHSDQITALCFDPSGAYLVSAGGEPDARARSVRRAPISTHQRFAKRLTALYPPQHHVKVWSVAEGTLQQTLAGHEDSVTCVAASRGAQVVVSGAADLTVRVWDGRNGTLQQTYTEHQDTPLAVAVTGDGSTVISGGMDARAFRRRVAAARVDELRLSPQMGLVRCVAINAEQDRLASCAEEGVIRLWDLRELDAAGVVHSPDDRWVTELAISRDGGTVVAAWSVLVITTGNAEIFTCDWQRREVRVRLALRGERVTALASDGDATRAVVNASDGGATVWDISRAYAQPEGRARGSLDALAVRPGSPFLLAGTDMGQVLVLDRGRGRIKAPLQRPGGIGPTLFNFLLANNPVARLVELIIGGLYVVSAHLLVPSSSDRDDDEVDAILADKAHAWWQRLVPAPLRRRVEHIIDRSGGFLLVTAVALSADGRQAAAGFNDGVVKVWRRRRLGLGWSLRARWRALADDSDVDQIALGEGDTLLTAADNEGVAVWALKSGRLIRDVPAERTLFLRGQEMQAVVTSKATFSWDQKEENDLVLRLVDLRTGVTTHEVTCAAVQAVAHDRSGVVYARAKDDNSYWWDLDTGTSSVAGEYELWNEVAGANTVVLAGRRLVLTRSLGRFYLHHIEQADPLALWSPLVKITAHLVDWERRQIILGNTAGDLQILDILNLPAA